MKFATLFALVALAYAQDDAATTDANGESAADAESDQAPNPDAISEEEAKAASEATKNACPEDGCKPDGEHVRCCG